MSTSPYLVTFSSPTGGTRISRAVAEDLWLDTVMTQLLLDKYLPLVIESEFSAR